ncbi:hypothetical protein K458DRAFT_92969 [Lentithecium fluviatile CBS 122367]|uniref:Uncharacterized protein n=1 Tax=Lentithecium fluviatile CBS 122367 TaxID=1168545 RepID=A0A6G1IQA3_9PLEO|nr:hypothetical protein K458DRAFT_92969 [Lentithecium fluviatile CBS 122367]
MSGCGRLVHWRASVRGSGGRGRAPNRTSKMRYWYGWYPYSIHSIVHSCLILLRFALVLCRFLSPSVAHRSLTRSATPPNATLNPTARPPPPPSAFPSPSRVVSQSPKAARTDRDEPALHRPLTVVEGRHRPGRR